LIIAALLAPWAQSQTPQSNSSQTQPGEQSRKEQRARICVALEGGGALGLAHIGVLQWFEDHHIPIDYIAGTSMGGLVAGLYATGRSPQQLADLVSAQNWDIIIGGKTPYEDLSYRRREDQRAFQNPIVVGLKHGLTLPAGVNAGQQISTLMVTLPPFVGGRVYAIGAYEFGKMYGARNESGFPNDFAAGVLAETVSVRSFLAAGSAIRDTTNGSSSLATCSKASATVTGAGVSSTLCSGIRSRAALDRYSIQPPVTLMTWPVM
jgi:hypothetical protein